MEKMNQEIIKAWKDPEYRKGKNISHPSGQAFTELSIEEMINIQGAGDVQPNTTPTITTSSTSCWVGGGVLISKYTSLCN
jgi:type 2 lantibiotic (TIGR03893 family)